MSLLLLLLHTVLSESERASVRGIISQTGNSELFSLLSSSLLSSLLLYFPLLYSVQIDSARLFVLLYSVHYSLPLHYTELSSLLHSLYILTLHYPSLLFFALIFSPPYYCSSCLFYALVSFPLLNHLLPSPLLFFPRTV